MPPENLSSRLQAALAVHAEQRLCVGFSGGLDSSVLLHLLAKLAPVCGFSVSALHVHHGLSPHADDWAAHCERVALSLNVSLAVQRVQVTVAGEGLEAAARTARHVAFAGVDCDWIVLAHHRGDQAETVLHRLMRGTGVHGVGAMRARDEARRLLRPLLDVPRSALEAYARARGLHWIEDESNTDTALTRNFLRREVLPVWSARQPALEANLARAAGLFAEGALLLDELAAEDALRVAPGEADSLLRLRALSVPRARNLLRHLLVRACGLSPEADRLGEALRQLCEAQEGVRLVLVEQALCAWRERFWLEAAVQAEPVPQVWQGEASLPWGAGVVRFAQDRGPRALRIAPGAVRIATRAGGERLRPLMDGPSRAFKQLAQEADIPPWQRDGLPCLWQGNDLLWIGGLGVAAEHCCAPDEQGWQVAWVPWSDQGQRKSPGRRL
ncbi:tRNA lysidine(34) synthetase TilS [Viridibacterium curvum]|uniref:tRNA(Ile)-lysidine synthase n=1 Tax=Viridibacterium curvum TaxID=1101404 RepID=A0ABP9R1T4_9RHOO